MESDHGRQSDLKTDQAKSNCKYNHVFDDLVVNAEAADVLEGYIAYVGYKIVKREWVEKFYSENGRYPDEVEMRAYIATWTPTMVGNLQSRAKQVLTAYASYLIEKSAPQIREEALSGRSFFRDALVAFCGAFFYSLVLILAAVVLHFFGIDLVEVSKNLSPK